MSKSQLSKLKSWTKHGAEVILNFSSNVIGHSDNETNFLYKLFLADRKVSKLCKALLNKSSANIKLPKDSTV